MHVQLKFYGSAYLRSKRIDDLTCQRLRELEDKDDRKLGPWNGRVMALAVPVVVLIAE